MTTRSYVPVEYFPTSPRSGNDGSKVFRMQNMILRGTASEPYAECYSGSMDLGENIPATDITGTVTTLTTTRVITGTGTAFLTELHLGQFLLVHLAAVSMPVVVDEIYTNTSFLASRMPEVAVSAAFVARLPVLFEMNKKRGTQLRGNSIELDLGTIIGVGDGVLRRNGAVLLGNSLDLGDALTGGPCTPRVAILDYTTPPGTYTVYPIGLTTPPMPTAADGGLVGPPNKNMQAGVYSVRIVPARLATRGYGNPSTPKSEVTLGANGHQIAITFPNVVASRAVDGQDAWMIFVTQYTTLGGINGPWYRYELPEIMIPIGVGAGMIPAAGGVYNIEYNDAEVSGNDILTFNNDAPPKAEFVTYMGGIPVWVSCQGPGGLPPGPFIAPGKPRNIEAVPAATYVSAGPPDTIIGIVVGTQGRFYLMCVNSLQIGIATQSVDSRIAPFAVRPFWRCGFKNPETLLFVGNNLIGMTTNGLARSIADGDEGTEEFGFAIALEELLRGLTPGHFLLKLDPKNNAILLIQAGNAKNAAGYWTSRVWMYGMREGKWIGDILLSDNFTDMVVSSGAVVNGQLEFLCGGRTSSNTVVVRTLRWDSPQPAGAGIQIPWYMAWQFSDYGDEERTKTVKAIRFIGKITGGSPSDYGLCIAGAEPGDDLDVAALETTISGKSGRIIPNTVSMVGQSDIIELDVDNLSQLTVKVFGNWDGLTTKDRVDEVVLDVRLRGAKR